MLNFLFLPIILLSLLFFIKQVGRNNKYLVTILLTFTVFDTVLYSYKYDYTTILILGNWISVDFINILWSFLFSPFTLMTSLIVLLLTLIIQFYSLSYMDSDLNIVLFLAYLIIFSFFMVWFIYTNDIILNIIGWEGIGLLSYLLINFWNVRIESNKAGLKAIFINKFGDFFLMLFVFFIINIMLTTNATVINILSIYISNETLGLSWFKLNCITLLTILLIIASVTKSAQLFLNVWLPDAMEGPTPVSSLIHSATMVAAGFLLLIKYSQLLDNSVIGLPLIFYCGFLTSLVSSLESLCLFDHKSVLAGSTCDQLGMLFIIYGCGNINLAFFHFCTHAFYKSLLFLSLGAIIHQTSEQESRLITLVQQQTPLITITYQIGLLSLLGFPSIISHYSKALLINTFYIQSFGLTSYIWILSHFIQMLTNLNTLIGSISIYCIINSLAKRKKLMKNKFIFQSSFIKIPLIILSMSSLLIGLYLSLAYKYLILINVNTFVSNYWLNNYFIPSYSIYLSILFLVLSLFISYIWYNYFNYTISNVNTITWFNNLILNFNIDFLINITNSSISCVSYDLMYKICSNSLFHFNFYLRYLLYYNYFLFKVYSTFSNGWTWVLQSTFGGIVLIFLWFIF